MVSDAFEVIVDARTLERCSRVQVLPSRRLPRGRQHLEGQSITLKRLTLIASGLNAP